MFELAYREGDQSSEEQQVDRQRQQDEKAQAGAEHESQAFAQIVRARQDGRGHGGLRKLIRADLTGFAGTGKALLGP
ncbi:hypothetical protein GCM10017624_19610 [Azotobacter vinelandii]|nr:hypothetical protein GCM10017624_19610 [Azotobacter vinelandii]